MTKLLSLGTLLFIAGKPIPLSDGWAYRPLAKFPVPSVRENTSLPNPIDRFLTARLASRGLAFNSPADRSTLIRRVTWDLTGLLPTPAEVTSFLNDKSSGAYERVVRRLLASPHYGERWAQHWLDVVRYADSDGFEHDLDRPHAWRYRDWVVDSLNADKPYDQFLREQIAGDEIDPKSFEMKVATGFLRTGPFRENAGNDDPVVMRQDWLTETVANVGTGILGMSITCARCHDHKFDPISQKEYYQLQSYFAATFVDDFQPDAEAQKKKFDEAMKEHKKKLAPIENQIALLERPYRDKLRAAKMERLHPEYKEALAIEASKRTAEQKKLASEASTQLNVSWDEVVDALTPQDKMKRTELRRQIHKIDLHAPQPPVTALTVIEKKEMPQTFVLVRGDAYKKEDEVFPGTPKCMALTAAKPEPVHGSPGRRLALAHWITQASNPLTSRVLVNRLWMHHFGKGLVGTPNDFGKMGEKPSHPELLDWLAATFTEPKSSGGLGWSLKDLHTLIVTSRAYRQSSAIIPAKQKTDPANQLLWRFRPRRMDAESLRDSTLQIAGHLNPKVGGPGIRIPIEPEVYETIFTEAEPDNLWPVAPDSSDHVRRSLYLFRKRNVRLPMLAVFDQPDYILPCGARQQSVHALQALSLINGEFTMEQSRGIAERILKRTRSGKQAVQALYLECLGRSASTAEMSRAGQFLGTALGSRLPSAERFADLCLALLNTNDFLTIR